ncbi:ASX homology domain-containing protein [Dipodascopsis uninucleata]
MDEINSSEKPRQTDEHLRKRQKRGDRWDVQPATLVTSHNSPLASVPNLNAIINKENFESLSEDQRRDLIALLPDVDRSDDTALGLVPDFFNSCNTVLQGAMREFQNDLSMGRFERQHMNQAKAAYAAVVAGKADKFKDGQFELYWGQKSQKSP